MSIQRGCLHARAAPFFFQFLCFTAVRRHPCSAAACLVSAILQQGGYQPHKADDARSHCRIAQGRQVPPAPAPPGRRIVPGHTAGLADYLLRSNALLSKGVVTDDKNSLLKQLRVRGIHYHDPSGCSFHQRASLSSCKILFPVCPKSHALYTAHFLFPPCERGANACVCAACRCKSPIGRLRPPGLRRPGAGTGRCSHPAGRRGFGSPPGSGTPAAGAPPPASQPAGSAASRHPPRPQRRR